MKRSTTGKRLTQKIEPTNNPQNRRERLAFEAASRAKTKQVMAKIRAATQRKRARAKESSSA